MNKNLYMAYGSNLNLRQMAIRCPSAKVFGTAMLEGYQLIFNGVATIVPKEGASVPVAIWEIDDACERSLDRYEGYPHLYRKEYIPLRLKGETRTVMVYIMNTGKPRFPTQSYYRTIEEGYHDVGLDPTYLHEALAETEALL